MPPKPVVLVVLDGYGLSPITEGNAIHMAKTPFLNWAVSAAPKALLQASGAEVGLDWGEMGNSEVGHLNIGTGRIVMQDLPRINRAIEDGAFFKNAALLEIAKFAVNHKSTMHIMGIASTGGVHGHLDHILAMLDFAKRVGVSRVALHLFADGRDTAQNQLIKDLPRITEAVAKSGIAVIASISGRYYAMDRDKRWDRTNLAYQAIINGEGRIAASADDAMKQASENKETDEFITPTVIVDDSKKPVAPYKPNDVVVFTNFRPDRARQLASALTAPTFTDFSRSDGPVAEFISFTSYGQEATPTTKVAFFASPMKDQLAELVAKAKLPQLHIAETEKYAHVTYFFNGGVEEPFSGEERILIPSPKVATYDLEPEMSAEKITKELVKRLSSKPPMLTVINFANADMVGHTGNLKKTIIAIETIDDQLKKIQALTKSIDGTLLITADHGNAEQMINPETKEIDKEHSTNPVPFFIIDATLDFAEVPVDADKTELLTFAAQPPVGVLADVAPTILELLELHQPAAMTGQSLKGRV